MRGRQGQETTSSLGERRLHDADVGVSLGADGVRGGGSKAQTVTVTVPPRPCGSGVGGS